MKQEQGILLGISENLIMLEILFLGFIMIILLIIYTIKGYNTIIKQKEPKIKDDKSKRMTDILNINYSNEKEALKLFESILLFKVQFYFSTELAALYDDEKTITKSQLDKLKDKFQVDVMKSIDSKLLTRLKTMLTDKGIILYINQFFITELNKFEMKKFGGNTETKLNDKMKGLIYGV